MLLLALAVLIAGFVARRSLLPQFLHYLTYRAPDSPRGRIVPLDDPPPEASAPGASGKVAQRQSDHREQITPADQRELDEVLRGKTR